MEVSHDALIYSLVGLIICLQVFFFLKNLFKIRAYRKVIGESKNLSVIELSIDQESLTSQDPDYFIENKRLYKNNEGAFINAEKRKKEVKKEYPEEFDFPEEVDDEFKDIDEDDL